MTIAKRRWLALLVHPQDVVTSSATRDAVQCVLASGVLDLLQLRSTGRDAKEDVVAAGTILRTFLDDHGHSAPLTKLVVNHESIATATATKACGWHLKEQFLVGETKLEMQKRIQNAHLHDLIVGCSVHSVEAALFAADCGVDYIQVGTMFATASHPEKALLEGPPLLKSIHNAWKERGAATSPLPPLVAVGGISSRPHIGKVFDSGADGVAVIRGILAAEKPFDAARLYREWVDQWYPRERNSTSVDDIRQSNYN